MIIIKNDKITHVDSSTDILEHYGVQGMKWGKHRANMKAAKKLRKVTRRNLNYDDANLRNGYGIMYAIGAEGAHTKNRNTDFRSWAEKKANNDTSVKRQKYIDKYSTDGTINGLNDKGKKKYSKLQSKNKKLVNKHYNNMEVGYQNNKHRYHIV